MNVFEEFGIERKIKKYKKLADKLNSSVQLFIGGRAEKGINAMDLLVASNGDFVKYERDIKKILSSDYNTDFLDFSLLTGHLFGIYNEYCYQYINKDVRVKLINNSNINRKNTMKMIGMNCVEICSYLTEKYNIGRDEFFNLISSLFVIDHEAKSYNNPMIFDIVKMLFGNYLYLADNNLEDGFLGCSQSIEYFDSKNKKNNIVSGVRQNSVYNKM